MPIQCRQPQIMCKSLSESPMPTKKQLFPTPAYINAMIQALQRIDEHPNPTLEQMPYITSAGGESLMLQVTRGPKDILRKRSTKLFELITLRDECIVDVLTEYFMTVQKQELYTEASRYINLKCAFEFQGGPPVARCLDHHHPCQHPMVKRALAHLHHMSLLPKKERRFGKKFLDFLYALNTYFYANDDALCHHDLMRVLKKIYYPMGNLPKEREYKFSIQTVANAYGPMPLEKRT